MPQASTLPQLYRAAEAKAIDALDEILAQIEVYQDAYYLSHGRYLQLLPTHSAVPDEAAAQDADELDRAPADRRRRKRVPDGVDANGVPQTKIEVTEDDTWRDTKIPPPPECCFSVHDYDGPLGKGYVVQAKIKVGPDTVVVTRPYGPEKHRKASTVVLLGSGEVL